MGNKVGGEVKIQLTVLSVDKNIAHILVKKEITPFSQILDFATIAEKKSGKYFFSCFDNWENEVFGFFYFENEQVIFFLDCKNFSSLGKNLIRFYGDTIKLTNVTVQFPITNFE